MQCEALVVTGNGHSIKPNERCPDLAEETAEDGHRFCWLHYSVISLGLGDSADLLRGRRRKVARL